MPYKLNKIIFQRDWDWGYESYEYDLSTEIEFSYAAGMLQDLVPKQKSQISKYKKPEYSNISLFNDKGLAKLIPEVGPKGIYYLELRPGYKLKQLVVEPDEVVVDIYIGPKDTLIYSFYNPTRRNSIAITTVTEKDAQVYLKIKSNLTDIHWRQYFVRVAQGDNNNAVAKFPENMTAEQVADYIQADVKTIRNWTSEGKIPFVKLGGSARYPKKRIDNWLKSKEKKSIRERASN